jgi:hypothetical protein
MGFGTMGVRIIESPFYLIGQYTLKFFLPSLKKYRTLDVFRPYWDLEPSARCGYSILEFGNL